jgi:serine/threonine protein kinase
VVNTAFTAPEQLLGQASIRSELYSVAATIYFMANGVPPERYDGQQFRAGLSRIETGNLMPLEEFSSTQEVIEALLEDDVSRRPSDIWSITLHPVTAPFEFDILGVLNIGTSGYLVICRAVYLIGTIDEIRKGLQIFGGLVDFKDLARSETREDVKEFLARLVS